MGAEPQFGLQGLAFGDKGMRMVVPAKQGTTAETAMMLVKATHLLVSVALFWASWMLFRYGQILHAADAGFRYNYYVAAAYAALLLWFSRTYRAYLFGYFRIRDLAFAQGLGQTLAVAATYVGVSLAWGRLVAPWPLLGMLCMQFALDALWSYVGNRLFFAVRSVRRTVLVYRSVLDRRRFDAIVGKPIERLYEVCAEIQHDGSFEELGDQLDAYDAVFVAGVNTRCRNGIVKYCKERNVPVLFLPHVGDLIMREAIHITSLDAPVLYVGRSRLRPEYRIAKRAFDVCASLAGIVVLSPLMAVTALAIKLYDGGPALYKQVRLTKDGKEFEIWKFRSMRVDAEADGVARLSTGEGDSRITPVGRFARKCRLDELPQLFNILAGDMSVVGPRPERPEIAEHYCEQIPDFRLRLQVKAGLTGYAQVYGKYSTDPYEKLEFDLLYISEMSALTDLRLMFATLAILGRAESTEGVKGVTALE